jgi:hypothetical protein
MAAKKKTQKKPVKSACVYGLWEELVAPADFIGAFATRAKATAEMKRRKKKNPTFDYWVGRLCVR